MSAPIMHAAILPPCRSAVRAHSSQSAAQTLPARRIVRDVNEAARDVARALAKTEAFARSRRDRKKVEMLFAHLKRILRLARLRLRGPSGAQFEFTLAAIAQNLKRLAKLVARPTTGHVHGVPGVSCGAFHRRNADAPHGVRGERMDAPSPQKAAAPINATSNPTSATISARYCLLGAARRGVGSLGYAGPFSPRRP